MDNTQFIFNSKQLNRLFPYFLLLDKNLSIKSCGNALNELIAPAKPNSFGDLFKIAGHNYTDLKAAAGSQIKITIVNKPDAYLEGSLEHLDQSGDYLFTGNLIRQPGKMQFPADMPAGKNPYIDFYQHVLNEVPADIAVFDINHTYQFLNASAIKDPELRKWMIGKTNEDYCRYRNKPMSIAAERDAHFKEVIRTKKIKTWEEKLTNQDGLVSYQLRNLYPVLDAQRNVIFVIGYGINITDRKQIEEQLELNEKRYRDLYNFSPALIFTHDTDGKINSVNPAICSVLGYKSEEIIGKNIKSLLPAADQRKLQFEYLNKVNTTGVSKGIFRINHKNGDTKYFFYQNYKVDEKEASPYIIGFSQDMTERVKTEKELLLAKHNSENMAKVKDTFLANMGHEIRTPMNGILGITKLLTKTDLDPKQKQYANLISDSVNDLLTIINDILDMEKIRSGQIKFKSLPFKVVDKITSVIHSFQYKAEQKDLVLTVKNILPANLIVLGDQHRLAQILSYLLSNAIKFTQEGSIHVSVNLVHYSDTHVIIEFIIQDTGIGISKDRIDTIFDPFVKAASNFNNKFGGTGLGLSICKSLINKQGGNIAIKSKLKEGTTITFNLPYKRGSSQMLNELQGNTLHIEKINKRVLVAEDIELNQFLIRTTLESWGCTVDIAMNGFEAVKMFNKADYDLILMDIRMPEMDGIKAAKLIRESAQPNANIPIIAFTANALEGDSKVYKDAGMNDYIIKPYTEEKLYEKITGVLEEHTKSEDGNTPENFDMDTELEYIEKPVSSSSNKLYNISMLEVVSKNNPSFIAKMIVMFVDVSGADVKKLKEASDAGDTLQVSEIAHKLKSTFGNMGIAFLLPHVIELEKGSDKYPELVEKLGEGLEQVFAQLRADYPDLFKG